MKKTKLALAISSAVFASSAIATNGTNMTGVGAQSSAIGGTGVAAYYGAENVIVNPAMIGKSTGTEFAFGGTIFMPNVKNDSGNGAGFQTSEADLNVIPSVSLSSRINENWTFGIGMYGTSGMGVDYSNSADSSQMAAQSTMQIMRFVPTIAYNEADFGVGFSPVIQYGALDIGYDNGSAVGTGMAQDLGYGFNLGGYLDVNENTTLALSYQSSINMTYGKVLEAASTPFLAINGAGPLGLTETFGNELEQPAEIKAGIAHTMGNYTLTADVKQVRWSEAKGYKDYGWEDQNIIALGAKYTAKNYWLGLGYNKADNPIKPLDATTVGGGITNMFNNIFFPATTEQHISVGGGYNVNKNTTIEGAVVMATENKTAVDIYGAVPAGSTTNTTKHSQLGYTVSVKMNF